MTFVRTRVVAGLFLAIFASLPAAADPIVVDSQDRDIGVSADHRRTVTTSCYATTLPPFTVFKSKECGSEIAQDSQSHKDRVPPTAYVQIAALFKGAPISSAADALAAAYVTGTADPSATMKTPPKPIGGFRTPFQVASYAIVEATPGGACDVTDDGSLVCSKDDTRKVAVIMYYVDAPADRFTLDGKPIAIFSITCKIPEGPDFEEQEYGCRDVATSFKFK